jgi:tetrahydromethanopterin S-methyltransferase subunit E
MKYRWVGYLTVLLIIITGGLLCTLIGRLYDAPMFGTVLAAMWGVTVGNDLGRSHGWGPQHG